MEKSRPKDFIASLRELAKTENRAALADLRHGVADAAAHRAWPHIAPFCNLRNKNDLPAFIVVGAGFAMHGRTDQQAGNLGNTLRILAVEGREGTKEEALKSFAARFRRLLTCNRATEAGSLLPGILRAAARKEISVNYELLLEQLLKWNNEAERQDIKLRWAEAYWGAQ